MQVGGNAKFIAYAKQNGLHGAEIASKYQSEAAAIYAAKLKAEATGEPYVSPPPANRPKPKLATGGSMGVTGMGGVTTYASGKDTGMGTGGNLGRIGNGYGSGGTGGMGAMGAGAAGISSDMWKQTNGNSQAMQSVSSSSYSSSGRMTGGSRSGGGGSLGGFGGFGGLTSTPSLNNVGSNLSNVGQSMTQNLSSFASQVQRSEVLGQAGKAAAQAGGLFSSWLTNVSTQATKMMNENDGRDELRQNLRQNLTAEAAGKGFKGFSSEDYQRSYGGTQSQSGGMNGGVNQIRGLGSSGGVSQVQGLGSNGGMSHSKGGSMPSLSSADYSNRTQRATGATQTKTDLGKGGDAWGGFDDVAVDSKEKKDPWGAWD